MQLDIRTPIALMFGLLGLIVTGYGFAMRHDPETLRPALGININLWWGLVMLVFALSMYIWSRIDPTEPKQGSDRSH